MAIRVALHHKTTYAYDKFVAVGPHLIRLRPAPHSRTPILAYSLKVEPAEHFINWQQDAYSNYMARVVFPKPAKQLSVTVDLIAELTVINPFDFFIDEYAEKHPFKYDDLIAKELIPYLETLPPQPLFAAYLADAKAKFIKPEQRSIDVLVALNQHVQSSLKYDIRMEPGVQSPEESLAKKHGSCRDFAWLLVQLMRHFGFAARFVSGYSIQLVADVKALDGPSGVAQDVTDLHAWAEAYLPGAGWIGFDATSGLLAGEGHIPLACTAEPSNAAPISGGFAWLDGKEGKADFSVTMSITRIHEDPRVTKPYTDEEWNKIEALGHQIDADLLKHDVRLSMGGEPTFVSIDDMEGAQWTTDAHGKEKRELAGNLIRRLQKKFAPGGLLHYGQGKWYPGESLPRWSLACYWRKDGVPVWENHDLIADERHNYGYRDETAARFIHALAENVGVDPRFAEAGFEDTWYYLWKERRLPTNVDPFDSKLKNPEDRARLAKIFEQGLDSIVGYALPLQRIYLPTGAGWASGKLFFRPQRMYLLPGDSPMGFRLPLDSFPWSPPSTHPFLTPMDPSAPRGPLHDPRQHMRNVPSVDPSADPSRDPRQDPRQDPRLQSQGSLRGSSVPPSRALASTTQNPSSVIRTALCVEPRNGRLHVFMPPQYLLEDYLDLTAAVEKTAADLNIPVIIEGYTPPPDPRINTIKATPDPGVIEVNIHPSTSWDQLVTTTTTLYEEARQTRLGTEKFMVDGRHTGTGGGNHIVIGGPTAPDSPFLRRPDLLASLVSYWHNHPSLSYLFSGTFIGPTSQAPRVDEARRDLVYELEIAFKQLPKTTHVPPWLVDRTLRNILVDLTGNTHRAEFCIDKLYSPDSSSGRLGLVEFRGFEMPPHARMSLTQQLLLRALVSRFWKVPYRQPLVRWGTEIHDRFMLPHFVGQDFDDVVYETQRAGYPIQPEWFAPHMEFRFPVYGTVGHRDINVELRQAIEPWYVLGEEPAGGATVRYVDSSVERLQVKVSAMTDTRHVVTCNGQRLPLHPTGVNGQFVAGVRYRAWQPPNCLHPNIGVHTPLVFDLVDSWAGRSVGGCTYHVAHPGGRNYDTFPVNAFEAESRRIARFFPTGHTPGSMTPPPLALNPEFPFTLDLRRNG
jgi:uncharacterized protein (DUF2126 family)/transglutaminase-like putative cysteine protease